MLWTVSDFLGAVNQTLDYAYGTVALEGEVSSFKVNQNKYVFFDLKDETGSVGCFMTVWQMRMPIEDGMKVVVSAQAKITDWGKFSLTVQSIRPSGEGSIKKSSDLLKEKLAKEGLFDESRKRPLPAIPKRIGVIGSTESAGYADFIKIINENWGGLEIVVAHTTVQGDLAADQMIGAIDYFNQQPDPVEALVLIRGGGSIDDLAAYNDERLVRHVAGSRIPTMVGVGHEIDTTLCDLVCDKRAATPSNAAQLIVPNRKYLFEQAKTTFAHICKEADNWLNESWYSAIYGFKTTLSIYDDKVQRELQEIERIRALVSVYDPKLALKRGFAIVRGPLETGGIIELETAKQVIKAEVKNVESK